MNSVDIPKIKYHAELPACWEELDQPQFEFIVSLYLELKDKKINVSQFKKAAVLKMLDIKMRGCNKEDEDVMMDIANNINRLSELFEYFFIQDEDRFYFNFDFHFNIHISN